MERASVAVRPDRSHPVWQAGDRIAAGSARRQLAQTNLPGSFCSSSAAGAEPVVPMYCAYCG